MSTSGLKLHVRSPELTPKRANPTDSGFDLCADLLGESAAHLRTVKSDAVVIHAGYRCKIPCGVWTSINPGYELQVRSRSGLAAKNGIQVLNSPGTIDSSYRGEIAVILMNHGSEPVSIKHGDRIAQMIVAQVALDSPELVDSLDALGSTSRGSGGFGSTGV